jgi:hypothetical protein
MDELFERGREVNPLELGAAYLDYCVKQGWLTKTGEGSSMQYELTSLGEIKLAAVPFNFDLSKVTRAGAAGKKKRKHRK